MTGKIFTFSSEWKACDLNNGVKNVRGFGTTNVLALLDAMRLLSLNF